MNLNDWMDIFLTNTYKALAHINMMLSEVLYYVTMYYLFIITQRKVSVSAQLCSLTPHLSICIVIHLPVDINVLINIQ